jgi:hypothetical protein
MKPIRKGANPVKIPFQIKSTDPTLAAWCNEVRTAIRQLEARVPTASFARPTSSAQLQFKVYGVRYDATAEAWKCKVRPGYVRTINPDADATEPVKDWMPTVGSGPAVPLDDATPPEITIADGQTIYCRVATTAKGVIEAAPKIEAAATPEAGTHFQPPDADVEGDLYFPIADIEIAGDPEVVTVTQIQQGGPIVVVPNLPELKNIGGEREVFAGRTAAGDTYDLRTLEQLIVVNGAEIIKPLGESEEEGDTIPFRSIVKNNSEGVPYTIIGDGDAIEVTLQGANGTYDDPFDGSITFAGGLVTEFVSSDVEGKNLNLTIENLEYAAGEIVGSPYLAAILYFRGGVYIGMTDPEDEPAQLDEATVTRMIEGS